MEVRIIAYRLVEYPQVVPCRPEDSVTNEGVRAVAQRHDDDDRHVSDPGGGCGCTGASHADRYC